MSEKLIEKNIEDEMKESYLNYAMSVIVGRALPDVRDGLKPVQRRILYTMFEMGLRHNQPFKKCARIIGDVLGKYHPHGDMAVYEALVRMAQNFTMRYPLIEGQGNFGSIDGDPPAAMRYTEARLHRISEIILEDIDKETVNFIPNYDNSLLEPQVLPAKLPNLLISGSSGIAVGMATNIPPHNLSEVVDAIIAVIDEPQISPLELMKYLKGPDFPTGGIICGIEGIKDYFQTGKGIIKIRGRAKIEDIKGARKAIVITELPYQVNKSQLLERISELLKEGKIEDISNIRDESDKQGMRIVIELKRDADPEVILNQLYIFTQLEISFGVILLALVDGQTKILNIVELIQEYIKHRRDIIYKRTKFDLQKAESRAHILEGFKLIINNLNQVINLIRNSKDHDDALMKLIQKFNLTKRQAEAILQLRLQQLTALERKKIEDEYLELIKKIETYKSILANPKRISEIIKQELQDIKDKFGDKRLTEIQEVYIEKKKEDIIKEEDVAVLLSSQGYIKRTPLNLYRLEERGEKGNIGMLKKEEDTIIKIEATNTLSYLLLFSDKGRMYQIRTYELPEGGRSFKGKPLVNFIPLEKEEKITALLAIDSFESPGFLTMVTKNGIIKKTNLSEFLTSRKSILAIELEEGDTLIDVKQTSGKDDIFISTKLGLSVRFPEKSLRPMGRNAKGVIGIKLMKNDSVIGCETISLQNDLLLTATENGYGKMTKAKEYRQQGRATKGVVNIRITDKNGPVVGIKKLSPDDDVLFVTEQGMTLRLQANSIPVYGRGTQGVRLLKLAENDKLVSLTRIPLAE